MVGWHHLLSVHEFEQALGVGDGQGGLACCGPWGRKESDTIEQLNNRKIVKKKKKKKINLQSSPGVLQKISMLPLDIHTQRCTTHKHTTDTHTWDLKVSATKPEASSFALQWGFPGSQS